MMGEKHRNERKKMKTALRQLGTFETELGELKLKMTKTKARRLLVRREVFRIELETHIIQSLSEAVKRDIDEEVFGELHRATRSLSVSL